MTNDYLVMCNQCGAIIRCEDAWMDEYQEQLLCDDCWESEQRRIWYDPQEDEEATE